MTNMTRRNFLKSAGVMTLAVAAAGVLSGCDSSSKNPVMADVEVQYWYESALLGKKTQVDDGSYTETVSVVKGGNVKKSQLTKLGEILGTGSLRVVDNAEEFEVTNWETENPVAEVHLEVC